MQDKLIRNMMVGGLLVGVPSVLAASYFEVVPIAALLVGFISTFVGMALGAIHSKR